MSRRLWAEDEEITLFAYGCFFIKHGLPGTIYSTARQNMPSKRKESGIRRKWSGVMRKYCFPGTHNFEKEDAMSLHMVQDPIIQRAVLAKIQGFEEILAIKELHNIKSNRKSPSVVIPQKRTRQESVEVSSRPRRIINATTSGSSLRSTDVAEAPSESLFNISSRNSPVQDYPRNAHHDRQELRRVSPPTISPLTSVQSSPQPGPELTVPSVHHDPSDDQIRTSMKSFDLEDPAPEFRLMVKAILSKMGEDLDCLLLKKEIDETVFCETTAAFESLNNFGRQLHTTNSDPQQVLSQLRRAQGDFASMMQNHHDISMLQSVQPIIRGFVDQARWHKRAYTLVQQFRDTDSRLEALTDRPSKIKFQDERDALNSISDHINAFAQECNHYMVVNLPSLSVLEDQVTSDIANLISRALGLKNELNTILRRRNEAFLSSGKNVVCSLIVSALCLWVYESSFPQGLENSELRYRLLRRFALAEHDGRRPTEDELDRMVQEAYMDHDVFKDLILEPRAILLARRLSATLAPFVCCSHDSLQRCSTAATIDAQTDGFHTWGQSTDEWKSREDLFTNIFKVALRHKASTLLGDERYEMIMPPPTTSYDGTSMKVHNFHNGPNPLDSIPTVLSACLLPALYVYPPVASADLNSRVELNYAKFQRFNDTQRTLCNGKCVSMAQVLLK